MSSWSPGKIRGNKLGNKFSIWIIERSHTQGTKVYNIWCEKATEAKMTNDLEKNLFLNKEKNVESYKKAERMCGSEFKSQFRSKPDWNAKCKAFF